MYIIWICSLAKHHDSNRILTVYYLLGVGDKLYFILEHYYIREHAVSRMFSYVAMFQFVPPISKPFKLFPSSLKITPHDLMFLHLIQALNLTILIHECQSMTLNMIQQFTSPTQTKSIAIKIGGTGTRVIYVLAHVYACERVSYL